MTWWPALLGWPALALGAGFVVAGVLRRNEYLVFGSLLPVAPLCFYLLGSPLFWWLPVVSVALIVAIGGWIRCENRQIT